MTFEEEQNKRIIRARQAEQFEASDLKMKSVMDYVSEQMPHFEYTTGLASEEVVLFEFFPWLKSFDEWQKVDRCSHIDVNNIDMMISLFSSPDKVDCYDCASPKVKAQDQSPLCDGCGTDNVKEDEWNNKVYGIGPFALLGYFCDSCDKKYFQ